MQTETGKGLVEDPVQVQVKQLVKDIKDRTQDQAAVYDPVLRAVRCRFTEELLEEVFQIYPFKKVYTVINVAEINEKYSDGETVNLKTLVEKKIVKKNDNFVKLLGDGELTKKLEVALDKVSGSAKEKVEKAGGKIVTEENKESRE